MKRVIVTPAGRERYLSILWKNLQKMSSEWDRWDVWINTENISDIAYIENLKKISDKVNLVPCDTVVNGNLSVSSFYKYATNSEELYLKLDDDIVYMHTGSIAKMFEQCEISDECLIVVGNTINNAIITYLHQREGNLPLTLGTVGYTCMDSTGWRDPYFAEKLHRYVLSEISSDIFRLPDFEFTGERVSINSIAWKGSNFKLFEGRIYGDDEHVLTTQLPFQMGKKIKLIGNTLFVHYAFAPQREYLDTTDILQQYRDIT